MARGIISHANRQAMALGGRAGMACRDAADALEKASAGGGSRRRHSNEGRSW